MTEPLYNSASVLQATCEVAHQEYPGKKSKVNRIAAAVDDYAQSSKGRFAVENLLLCGGPAERCSFREGAEDYVRQRLYRGIAGYALWVIFKPMVLAIIGAFIDSLLMGRD